MTSSTASTASLSTKLVRIGAGLLVVALASIGLTLWVTWQLEGGAAAVNEAGRMRMQTWRLTSAVQAQLPPAEVAALVTQFDESLTLLRSGDPSRPLFVPWDEGRQPRVCGRGVALAGAAKPVAAGDATAQSTQQGVGVFVDAIDRFVHAIEKELSGLTAILNLFQFLMMALAIGGAVVMLYTGYRFVINPLANMRQGLRQLEAGDFSVRVAVNTTTNLARWPAGFNRMAATLAVAVRRPGKPGGVEDAPHRSTARPPGGAVRGECISGQRQHHRRAFARVFAARAPGDEGRRGGRALVGRGQPALPDAGLRLLPARDAGRRAQPAGWRLCLRQPATRCAHPRDPDPQPRRAPMRHCAKVGYQNVVSVPVRLQQRLIGEIDLFFRGDIALNADETELLDALASHLASALEGLRAAALEREAAVGEERALIARELHDSIAQSLAFLKIQVQLLRSAVQKSQAEQVQGTLDELDVGLRESINDVRELLVHFRTRTNTDDIQKPPCRKPCRSFSTRPGCPRACSGRTGPAAAA
jgi:two-component system, NarL family, nitrate/nitrite sensor histidine kinase NarX